MSWPRCTHEVKGRGACGGSAALRGSAACSGHFDKTVQRLLDEWAAAGEHRVETFAVPADAPLLHELTVEQAVALVRFNALAHAGVEAER